LDFIFKGSSKELQWPGHDEETAVAAAAHYCARSALATGRAGFSGGFDGRKLRIKIPQLNEIK
jgi:hypothetical protein